MSSEIAKTQVGKETRQDEDGVRAEFCQAVADVLRSARAKGFRAVNFIMVEAYWHIGQMIVTEEQQGNERAEYGACLIRNLSIRLSEEFGRGFSEQTLWNLRQFFLTFPILSALRRELRWTHYKALMRVENENARHWYMNEAAGQNWSTRALDRQIGSLYYERILTSRDQTPVVGESRQLFASKYRLYLPSEDELRAEVEREREMVVRERMERYGVEVVGI